MKRAGWIVAVCIVLVSSCLVAAALLISNSVYANGVTAKDGTILVTSSAELQHAFAQAKDGDVIALAPGRYGPVLIKDVASPGRVIVRSADADRIAVLSRLELRNVTGFTFENLKFQGPSNGQRYKLLVNGGGQLAFHNLTFLGESNQIDPVVDGAVMLRNASNVQFTTSYLAHFKWGVNFLNVRDVQILDNSIERMQYDGIRGGGVDGMEIARNVITGFSPEPLDHPDGIQFWARNTSESSRNIHIHDNLVVRGVGDQIQGVFMRDAQGLLPFENVRINGNLAIGTLWNGIALTNGKESVIEDNVILSFPDQKSWIRVEGGNDVTVRNNEAMAYIFKGNQGLVEKSNRQNRPIDKDISSHIAHWLDSKPAKDKPHGALLQRLLATGN